MRKHKQPAQSIWLAYLELCKPNILSLVLVTTLLGYYLGGDGIQSWLQVIILLLGTALTASGSGALNHYLERDSDKLMDRTKNRPIPAGIILPSDALLFGIVLIIGGTTLLVTKSNVLCGFLSLLTAFLYVLVYTPLKKVTWLNTSVGSIPGALPPLGGWAAATGNLEPGAWILFAILFLWQHPHFYSIAWILKEDYAKADFKMLPVIEPDGKRTIRQIFWHLALLLPVSILPYFYKDAGIIYLIGMVILTLLFIASAIPISRNKSNSSALLLLKSSVIYLPIMLILTIADRVI